ncbi:hypothetical protein I6I10_05210 [Corynebacterium glucuronolyticum]|uniref:Uncharacterized protein n=1 Tax=Corynebacterium glucuronolyticum TaxID=39791 RepID=A0A7T4JVV0_9CORY|nr:hypothetical protein [Corynebacterium glucuronolyticum]QQB47297.1 hypothetical protein I6I10_05210 [Corynebacterium glucuronolyticum]WKD64376.1 hypothetical protein CGLUCO_10745 [Corynebacterium glucuronolyticum DSM 44120]SMB83116.1 hypothetical protein SAMN05660745_00988 [Corynebacterium glucuronolyticum]
MNLLHLLASVAFGGFIFCTSAEMVIGAIIFCVVLIALAVVEFRRDGLRLVIREETSLYWLGIFFVIVAANFGSSSIIYSLALGILSFAVAIVMGRKVQQAEG